MTVYSGSPCTGLLKQFPVFTARCYAECGYNATVCRLSVRPSVRPFVTFRRRDFIGFESNFTGDYLKVYARADPNI